MFIVIEDTAQCFNDVILNISQLKWEVLDEENL